MKNRKMRSLILFGILLVSHSGWAQDTLFVRNRAAIAAKVLKITPTEIEYKRWDNPDGPLVVVRKSEIASIRYANGTREVFDANEPSPTTTEPGYASPTPREPTLSGEEMYLRGGQDAQRYYRAEGPMWGSAGVTYFFPPAGLLIGAVVAAVPPRPPYFSTPDNHLHLLSEPMYVKGYQKEAHQRKIGKVAAGVGIGAGAFVITVLPFVWLLTSL